MNKERLGAILQSAGTINVTYNENPIWIQSISTDEDGKVLVKDLSTNKLLEVDINDLKE